MYQPGGQPVPGGAELPGQRGAGVLQGQGGGPAENATGTGSAGPAAPVPVAASVMAVFCAGVPIAVAP